MALHGAKLIVANVVVLLVGSLSYDDSLLLDLPLQLQVDKLLGVHAVQADDVRVGGKLGGVLVVYNAERTSIALDAGKALGFGIIGDSARAHNMC